MLLEQVFIEEFLIGTYRRFLRSNTYEELLEKTAGTESEFLSVCLFLSTATLIGSTLLSAPNDWFMGTAVASAVGLAGAALLVFYKQRLAYAVAFVAAVSALIWCVQTEHALSPGTNSWIELNVIGDLSKDITPLFVPSQFKLAAVALVLVVIVYSFLSLFSSHTSLSRYWRVRGSIMVAVFATAGWFASSVSPYRTPAILDGTVPEFRILRIERSGLQIHEVGASVHANGDVFLQRSSRQLFSYRFENEIFRAVMTEVLSDRARSFIHAAERGEVVAAPAIEPSWSLDEGWYLVDLPRLFQPVITEDFSIAANSFGVR
jgi:hypothetical protein